MWVTFKIRSFWEEMKKNNESTSQDDRLDLEIAIVPIGGYITEMTFVFGVHFSFYLVSLNSRGLRDLWASLLDIQKHLQLNEEFYLSIRNKCLFGFVLLILV